MYKIKKVLGVFCIILLIIGTIYHMARKRSGDTSGPVLVAESDAITESINASDEELFKDIVAQDAKDGDVSEGILIESIEKKEDGALNEFLITYVAFDNSGNVGSLTRTLFYSDYRQTRFSFTCELRFPENQPVPLLDYVTAEDCLDGEVTAFVTMEGDEELQEKPGKGFYDITLSVKNSAGAVTQLPIQVEIYEDGYEERSLRPQIYLKEYITYLDQGEEWDPDDYLDYIYDRGNVMIDYGPMVNVGDRLVTEKKANGSSARWANISEIKVESDVNPDIPGVYSVRYTYLSEETGYEGSVRLVVVIE